MKNKKDIPAAQHVRGNTNATKKTQNNLQNVVKGWVFCLLPTGRSVVRDFFGLNGNKGAFGRIEASLIVNPIDLKMI